jgi:hypothetical protein
VNRRDVLKPLARGLAQLLARDAGANGALALQASGLAGLSLLERVGLWPAGRRADGPADEPAATQVGIWEPRETPAGREFVRVAGREPWTLWSDVARIPPKRARRVVLIGESVARGFFYDPVFTVAGALEHFLAATPGLGAIEVVDLARTAIHLDPLLDLTRAAVALEPDAFVIFAGNNWWPFSSPDRIGPRSFLQLSRDLRGGIDRLRPFLERRLADEVARFVGAVAELAARRGVPALFVVPEFNLVDWRCDAGRHVPWLPGDRNARWLDARDAAERALAAGALADAAARAAELIELDRGVTGVGPSLCAQVAVQRGERAAARRWLETAKDAELWSPVPVTPRCFGVTQETLRRETRRRALPVVDLPQLFADHTGGALPDRRLFHDYCHLTAEGIAVAMCATAARLAPLLGAPPARAGATELASDLASALPPPRVRAEAHFSAAVHNANWGQPLEIVRHHCEAALAASSDIADAMLATLDFRVRRAPSILCASFAELGKTEYRACERFLTSPRDPKTAGVELERAITGAVEPLRPGTCDRAAQVRRDEHAIEDGPLDLLAACYAAECFSQHELKWEEQLGFYRGYERRSRFLVVRRDPATDVELDVTLRLPYPGEGDVAIRVGGVELARVRASATWARRRARLPAAALPAGASHVELHWPSAAGARGDDALAHISARLRAGSLPELYPVFGEIHELIATAG